MNGPTLLRVTRCVCVGAALYGVDRLAWELLAQPARSAVASLQGWQEQNALSLVADGAVLALAAALVALSAATALTAADALADSRLRLLAALARGSTPAAWRRIVLAVCAVGLVAPAPAMAADGEHPHGTGCSGCGSAIARTLDGLPLPQLPAPASSTAPDRPSADAAGTRPRRTTVRPGECLWTIAERLLPSRADTTDVAALTAALYAENRAVIGPDPGLVFPGTRLTVPEGRP